MDRNMMAKIQDIQKIVELIRFDDITILNILDTWELEVVKLALDLYMDITPDKTQINICKSLLERLK